MARFVEIDGKPRDQFDMIDTFIARHSIQLDVAEEAMAMDSLQLARMLVDIHVPRAQVIRLHVCRYHLAIVIRLLRVGRTRGRSSRPWSTVIHTRRTGLPLP